MEIETSIDNGVCTVALRGRFTFMDHAQFRDIMEHMHEPDIREVVCDMAGVEFIDSAGLGMLLLARDEAQKTNISLVIRNVTGQVKKIFGVAHFDTMFTIV